MLQSLLFGLLVLLLLQILPGRIKQMLSVWLMKAASLGFSFITCPCSAPALLQVLKLLHQSVQLFFHVLLQFASFGFPSRSHPRINAASESDRQRNQRKQGRRKGQHPHYCTSLDLCCYWLVTEGVLHSRNGSFSDRNWIIGGIDESMFSKEEKSIHTLGFNS